MKKRRRDIEIFSLSFLDCICCAFGAIILLFVLSKFAEPMIIEEAKEDLESVIERLEEELKDLRNVISQELDTHQLQTDVEGTTNNETDVNLEPSELSDSEAESLMLGIYIELGIWMAEDAEDTTSYEEMVAA